MRKAWKFITGDSFSAALSVTVIVSLIALTAGFRAYVSQARAAAFVQVQDVLSDSAPSVASNHHIQFTTNVGIPAGQSYGVTFPVGWDLSAITVNDVDVLVNGAQQTLSAAACPAANEQFAVMGQSLQFTVCAGGTISTTSQIAVVVGLSASSGGAATHVIANPPTTGSNELTVSSTDNGQLAYTRVMILPHVAMTAQVQTTFDFQVAGTATGTVVNGETTTISTTSTLIGFGVLTPTQAKSGAHQLKVVTNATNGFRVTVMEDHLMRSQTGAVINLFVDGATTYIPVVWASPANTMDSPQTYGHYGVTSDDDTLITWPAINPFNGTKFSGAIDGPLEIFSHTGPVNGTTVGKGIADILYKIEISPLQPAATDYTNNLIYVATPTF